MRRSLLYSFLLLILILSVLLLSSTIFIGSRISNQLSISFFNHAIVQTNSFLHSVGAPVHNALLQTKKSFETGLLDINNTEELNRFFTPIMDQIPYITSINTGDADGNGYLILRSEDSWKNRLVRPGKWNSKKVQWLIFNRKLEFQEKLMQDSDYDPRRRPWYELAINAKDATVPVWTQPYIFILQKNLVLLVQSGSFYRTKIPSYLPLTCCTRAFHLSLPDSNPALMVKYLLCLTTKK